MDLSFTPLGVWFKVCVLQGFDRSYSLGWKLLRFWGVQGFRFKIHRGLGSMT